MLVIDLSQHGDYNPVLEMEGYGECVSVRALGKRRELNAHPPEVEVKTEYQKLILSLLLGIGDRYSKKPLKECKVFASWKWFCREMGNLLFKPCLFTLYTWMALILF